MTKQKQLKEEAPVMLRATSANLEQPAYEGDVGYNLHTAYDQMVPAGSFAQIKTGIKVHIPDGYWGLIIARSSANLTGRIIVLPGVVDAGYRGELTAMCHNVSDEDQQVLKGVAVAQLVLVPAAVFPVEYRLLLDPSARGDNGYGSSGSSV